MGIREIEITNLDFILELTKGVVLFVFRQGLLFIWLMGVFFAFQCKKSRIGGLILWV